MQISAVATNVFGSKFQICIDKFCLCNFQTLNITIAEISKKDFSPFFPDIVQSSDTASSMSDKAQTKLTPDNLPPEILEQVTKAF